MKKFLQDTGVPLLLILYLQVFHVSAFYMSYGSNLSSRGGAKSGRNLGTDIRTMDIMYDRSERDLFPRRFEISFNQSWLSFTRVENDANNPIASADIYTIDGKNQKPVKYNLNDRDQVMSHWCLPVFYSFNYCNVTLGCFWKKFEIYKESSGSSYATLIRNEEVASKDPQYPFRMVRIELR